MSVPVRTCAGCGRKAPKAELLRFVAHEGALSPSATSPGRGVYTCPRLSCFERALSRRAFARTLRQPVRVESGLAERLRLEFDRIDRPVQTDARAEPVRPGSGTASGA